MPNILDHFVSTLPQCTQVQGASPPQAPFCLALRKRHTQQRPPTPLLVLRVRPAFPLCSVPSVCTIQMLIWTMWLHAVTKPRIRRSSMLQRCPITRTQLVLWWSTSRTRVLCPAKIPAEFEHTMCTQILCSFQHYERTDTSIVAIICVHNAPSSIMSERILQFCYYLRPCTALSCIMSAQILLSNTSFALCAPWFSAICATYWTICAGL